jgi:hypothetical protein
MLILNEPIFHRPLLAKELIEYITSTDASSGLFLAAPRRTGKTTFIKEDLVPSLKEAGAVVIYADLWEDQSINPAIVITNAIRQAIVDNNGVVMQKAKSAGLTKFRVAGFEVDLSTLGSQAGDSITKALQYLAEVSKKAIVMVIDEAQHAQTTEEGRQTFFALKAARDALKNTGAGFRLVATGSNSDKLASLVNSKDQAFYMAPMEELVQLDDEYLAWVLETSKYKLNPSLEALARGFDMCSHRPELLKKILRDLSKEKGLTAEDVDARFEYLTISALAAARDNFIKGLNGLEPLAGAILRRMAHTGKEFTPFDTKALEDYSRLLKKYHSPDALTPKLSSVQASLERLRKDGLVWNAGRGQWFIEDTQHISWIKYDIDGGRRSL